MTELVSWFQLEYPELVTQMKNSNHHKEGQHIEEYVEYLDDGTSIEYQNVINKIESLNPYHVESDVFTHTMMVCKQAENASYVVKIAALLHDIGKPSTRSVNPKNGRVSFYNHDAVSAFMSLEILKRGELGLSKKQIAHIFNLIALHTQIYKLTPLQLGSIQDDSIVVDLIELGKADHAGRFHTQGSAVIPSMLDVWRDYSYEKRRETDKEVVVLVGLPASGKSSYKSLMRGGYFSVCRDDIINDLAYRKEGQYIDYNEAWEIVDQSKVNEELQCLFKQAKTFDKVVVDMTHMSKKSRRKSLSHFDSSYKKKAVVFLTDLQTLSLRNSQRDGKIISKEVVDKMMRSFYTPTLEEFDEIEYIIS